MSTVTWLPALCSSKLNWFLPAPPHCPCHSGLGLIGGRAPPRPQVSDHEWVCGWLWQQDLWADFLEISEWSVFVYEQELQEETTTFCSSEVLAAGWEGWTCSCHGEVTWASGSASMGLPDCWPPRWETPHLSSCSSPFEVGFLSHPQASRQMQAPSKILAAVVRWTKFSFFSPACQLLQASKVQLV